MMGVPYSALLGPSAGHSSSGSHPTPNHNHPNPASGPQSDARVRLFTDLSPRTLRAALSLPTATRLRQLLQGFLSLRNAHPSAADYLNDVLLMRRALHVRLYDVGMSGQDLELYRLGTLTVP